MGGETKITGNSGCLGGEGGIPPGGFLSQQAVEGILLMLPCCTRFLEQHQACDDCFLKSQFRSIYLGSSLESVLQVERLSWEKGGEGEGARVPDQKAWHFCWSTFLGCDTRLGSHPEHHQLEPFFDS